MDLTDLSRHPSTIILGNDETGGLGELRIAQPPGAFALTPASLMAVRTIGLHRDLLSGTGFDWGTGCGVMAVAAAKIAAIDHVTGADITVENVTASQHNAVLNRVEHKTGFVLADSFAAADPRSQATLDRLVGNLDFVLANPPSSDGDDGFEFRRIVLRDARRFLRPNAIVFLSVSAQYGMDRIRGLVRDVPGYTYEGELASTDWVPFDLARPDLLTCLRQYAAEERRGGLPYSFMSAVDGSEKQSATAALAAFETIGASPLSKWQTHLFEFRMSRACPTNP